MVECGTEHNTQKATENNTPLDHPSGKDKKVDCVVIHKRNKKKPKKETAMVRTREPLKKTARARTR